MNFSILITTKMPRKIKQYKNPFLRSNLPLVVPVASSIPNLQDATRLHQQGKLEQAEVVYRLLLEIDAKNSDALHLLGVISYQTSQYQSAVDLINQAIQINPFIASYYSNLGLALQELKLYTTAVASYDKAIELKNDFADAYSNRGNALKDLQLLDAAVSSYEKAISIKPDYAEAYYNLGISLRELKQLDAAVSSYNKSITLRPNYAEAYSNKGIALRELKQLHAAIDSCKMAIALKPDYAEAYCNLGVALQDLRNFDAALANYDKAIAIKSDFAMAYSNRGNILKELKQLDAAVTSYKKAIALKPDYAEAYYNLGIALQLLKQFDEALFSYKKAITLKPDYAEAYFIMGTALEELKLFDAAVKSYDKAFDLNESVQYLVGMKLHAQMFTCDWHNFEKNLIQINKALKNNDEASPPLPIIGLTTSLAMQRQVAEIWVKDKYPYNVSLGCIPKKLNRSKIRIGYYSADFHAHPVSILCVGLFEHHDKLKFEIIAFSFGPETHDEIRGRIKNAFDKFIDVRQKSDKEVALLSRELGVDIAIDLGGYTQNCRTGIFSFRAAPIQLSYIGYLGTMGAEYYDYLIADRTIIPVNSQKYYSEKIVYLPTYQVNDSKQEIPQTALSRQELNLPSSGFVFCCFNANYKITPSTFDGWMRILNAVPESVLLLYADISTAAKNLKMEAEKRGVNPERLIFGEKLIRTQYLARCRSADLFLDTLPYNAGATASDALWAGLPVLTCMGDSFASRYAASMLFAIGLPELVTETQAEYEALAIELAKNPTKLKIIKDKLESNRFTTPLFDTALFTKHIEVAYTKIYERHQADLPPDHIYISNVDSKDKT